MRLDQLSVKNFKGFEEKIFEFSPRFNLLVGENGSGKSSALIGVLIGLRDWLVEFDSGAATIFEETDVHIKRVSLGDSVRFESQSPSCVEIKGRAFGVEFASGWLPRRQRKQMSEGKQLFQLAHEKKQSLDTDETFPIIAYFGANRLQTRNTTTREDPFLSKRDLTRANAYRGCADGQIAIDQVISWLKREQFIALQENNESVLLSTAKKAILQCLDAGVDLEYNVKELDLLVKFESGGWQPFSNLSDGQRSMTALVGDLAYRCAWLNPHLGDHVLAETPGVVLIDELDLHLHPRWQRRIIADLKRTFPKIQFICTTHSPFLIHALAPGELRQLDDRAARLDYWDASIEDIVEVIQGVEMPQRSLRNKEMQEAAERYFSLLRKADNVPAVELDEAERVYREASEPFTNQPAANALLKLESILAGKSSK